MFSVKARQVDWNDDSVLEWDISCPFCEGSGIVGDPSASWENADPTERTEICEELGIDVTTSNNPPAEVLAMDRYFIDQYFSEVCETECEECNNGLYEMLWNTVWEIGKTVSNEERRKADDFSGGCIVVYDPDGEAYLTLGGCGMDMTPHLCAAWVSLGFEWLPLEWIETLARNSGYLESCLGEEKAGVVKKVIARTITMARGDLNNFGEAFGVDCEIVHCVVHIHRLEDRSPMNEPISIAVFRTEQSAAGHYIELLEQSDESDGDITEKFEARLES